MSKKITLDELARNNNAKATITTPKPVTMGTSNKANMKVGDVNVLGAELQKAHPEAAAAKAEEQEIKNPEIVDDAFASLTDTINKKKKMADEMMSKAQEVAEENENNAELQAEFGELAGVENDEVETENDDPIDVIEPEEEKTPDELIDDIDKDLAELGGEDDDDEVEAPATVVNMSNQPDPVKSVTKNIKNEPKQPVNDEEFAKELEDIDDLLSEVEISDLEEDDDERMARIKSSIGEKVHASDNLIDFSQYTIQSEPVSMSAILNSTKMSRDKKYADWPLYYTGRTIRMEECDGIELDTLQSTINRSNSMNRVIATLKFAYNHNVDANKPPFEAWCQSIRTEDFDSLYFGLFMATYSDSCLLAVTDEEGDGACGKPAVYDVDPMNMVSFKDDDVKKAFYELMNTDTTTSSKLQESIPLQISDDFVITYKHASLYSTFVQYATIKEEIMNKYGDMLNTMAYVDQFFKIDRENKKLVPLKIKSYPNDLNKTVLTKLKAYNQILKTLNADQYNMLNGKLNNIIKEPEVTYQYPELKCSECGHTIPSKPLDSVVNLLFTRAQLAQIKNS